MKTWGLVLLLGFSLSSVAYSSAESDQNIDLEDKLKELNVPENELPITASKEKLFSVQTRYVPLKSKHELSILGARSFTAENFVVSYQIGGSYRFHLTDRWSLSANGHYVFNSLSPAGRRLIEKEKLYPDVAYSKVMADLMAGFHVFYGKFRLSMERVLYFDQYIALGGGLVNMDRGFQPAAVGDIGLVFWIGKRASFRFGLKDYFHYEKRRLSGGYVNDLLGHIDFGVLLGGEST